MAAWDDVMLEVERQCREREVPMLGREKVEYLAQALREKRPAVVLECGTALGYSGLWMLRELAEWDGRLITLEQDSDRAAEAGAAFERAGLAQRADQRIGDARETIHGVTETVDLLFLDNGYANYLPCFRGIESRLADGAVMVADNVGIGADEMKDYLDLVRAKYQSETVWFDLDLPWLKRDAMEVSRYAKGGPGNG